MIHSEENEGFDIGDLIAFVVDSFALGVLLFLIGCFIFGYNPIKEQPTAKPQLTELDNKCPSNTIETTKLTGSIGSVQIDSVTTDKLNFPMWCPLIEDKPRGWGLKK